MSEIVQLPLEQCEECHERRPAVGFVGLGDGYKNLCSGCYNRRFRQRMGLPELETVDLAPIVRRDAGGREHTFYFVVHMSTGLEVSAFEWVNNEPGGYRFTVLEAPEASVRDAYSVLVAKIERALSEQYLIPADFRDADPTHLHMAGEAINGRLDERAGAPCVVVDGREYTWEALGRFLSSHTGFSFRLECFDAHDEPPITSHPRRPHPPWWPEHTHDEHLETEEVSKHH